MRQKRVVLAYSGSRDSMAALAWLVRHYRGDVVTLTLDLGQGGVLEVVRDAALSMGALRAHVLDAREAFALGYVLPALKAGAMTDEGCPLVSALAHPLIAATLVDVAGIEEAAAIAHACPATSGRAPGPLDVAVRAINQHCDVVVPGGGHDGPSVGRGGGTLRSVGPAYAPAGATRFRVGANLWGRSIECEDELPEAAYTLTTSVAKCPEQGAEIAIAFEQGVPTSLNGVTMSLVDLIDSLGFIAGSHGVGRVRPRASLAAGVSGVRVYEAPAAVLLHAAHQELQRLVSSPDLDRFARLAALRYADLVASGEWFTPFRTALDAFVEQVQARVTGVVRFRLHKGEHQLAGGESRHLPTIAPTRPARLRSAHSKREGHR